MYRRANYKFDSTTDDALSFLKELVSLSGKNPKETQIVKDAIISAAIAKGWRKPKRKGKTKDIEEQTEVTE